jgi:transmembrane sensor
MRPHELSNDDKSRLDQAAAFRVRFAEGDMSVDEIAAFDAWLEASEANRAAYLRVEDGWASVGDVAGEPELVAMRGAAFEAARRAGATRFARSAWSTPLRAFSIAAGLLLIVLLGGSWFYLTPRSYETGIAERRVVALDDGSRISLDAATRVRVRFDGARRQLWLDQGRAKFDVARDPLRPFTVTAENRTVVATGTSFSVELLNQQVRVVLYEGHVAVLERGTTTGAEEPVRIAASAGEATLTPGHELIAAADTGAAATTATVDPVRSLSWEAGQLTFDNEPMTTAIARINRYTDSPITLEDDLVRHMHVSGVFRAGDTAAFVDGVTTLLPVRARTHDGGMVLFADAERLSH